MDDAQNYLKLSGRAVSYNAPVINGCKERTPSRPRILVFSSQDEKGIERIQKSYNDHFIAASDSCIGKNYLERLAFTLSDRRSLLLWRSFAICTTQDDLRKGIKLSRPIRALSAVRLAFCFTGQGAQWFAMGRELGAISVYSRSIAQSSEVLKDLGCPWSLLDELSSTADDSRVNEPEFSQTLCTIVQIALVDLLESVGAQPVLVFGHSSGEIAAAYCIGALDRRSAINVAYYRGLLSSKLANDPNSQGRMLAAEISETDVKPYFTSIEAKFGCLGVSVGCINSPCNVTVTGDKQQIDYLKGALEKDGVFTRELAVSVAYHSNHMDTIAMEYSKTMGKLAQRNETSSIKMVSSVTGDVVTHEQLCNKSYWVQNMVSPVRFAKALASGASLRIVENNQIVHDDKRVQFDDILEIGSHSALKRPIKDTLEIVGNNFTAGYTSALVRGVNAIDTFYNALGYLHCRGHSISIKAVNEFNSFSSSLPPILTDLPEYPFDHSNSYWKESRVSKGHRFREAPRNDFLGMRVPDWNPHEAKWRRRLKLSEDPWMADHKVARMNILPAATMIVMAIEAAKSVASSRSERPIAGYTLKDILFSRTITIIPDSDGTEVEFYLCSNGQAGDRENSWSDFRLYGIENDVWVEACRGSIRVSYVEEPGQVDKGLEAKEEAKRHAAELSRIRASSSRFTDMEYFYKTLADNGVEFGPAHQVIKSCGYNESLESFGQLNTDQWKAKGRKHQRTNFTIHPTSLDGLFQLGLVAMVGNDSTISPGVVAGIRRLWVAESDEMNKDEPNMLAWNKPTFTGSGNTTSTIVALDGSGQQSIVVADGIEGNFIKEQDNAQEARRLCWNFDYRPDIELLTQGELHTQVTTSFPIQPSPFQLDHDVKLLLYLCILRTLRQLTPSDIAKLVPHHQKYLKWMQREKEQIYCDRNTSGVDVKRYIDDDMFYDQLLDTIENENNRGKFYGTLARNLYGILMGTHDALEIMFRTPLVKSYYRELYKATNGLSKALSFLDLYAHKHPDIKILEIGAGTGGMTKYVLDVLTQNGSKLPGSGTPRFAHYTYTDISAGFFSDAASMFDNFTDKVTFAVLDIEKDPVLQGFEEGSYDLIIADNVFHATHCLDTTVKHARKLLRPDGKLALFELTNPEVVRTNFAFGLLPGWWAFSDTYREFSAGVSDTIWDDILRKTGFSGIDLNLQDYDDPICHEHSALISTAMPDTSNPARPPRTIVVFDRTSSLQRKVCETLCTALDSCGTEKVISLSLEEAANLSNLEQWFCIVVLEVGDCFLRCMNESQYHNLKTLLQADGGMLWVCMGGGERPELPDHALVQGAFRALRMEERASKFISLSLEATSTDPLYVSNRIIQIFNTVAVKPVDDCEQEYVERNGNICIDRFIEADPLNKELETLMKDTQSSESRFGDHEALALSIKSLGLLDSLEFVEDETTRLELASDEIEIKVEASGVNFRDCLIALGRIPAKSFGFECSGFVSRRGSAVSDLQVGDRVCASVADTYQTYTRCKSSHAMLLPDPMSFVEAATLPVVFTTAFYALVHVANIQKGESVLIHSAAGGTGQAAIQVAKLYGAEIFATVGSNEKRTLLMDTYQIPQDHIFDSRNTSFVKGIGRMTTDKGGVNVILNSLSGEFLAESWQCIAPFGRFIELGKKDILANGQLPMLPFSKNASFHAIDLDGARMYQPALLKRLRDDIISLMSENKISPPHPIHVYRIGKVEKAFRYLQSGKNTGKTVVMLTPGDVVKTTLKVKHAWEFNTNATYLIAGGLGGIGRRTARWMIERGAKNLVLLSRSGASNDEARELVDDLRKQGARVEIPLCDIADFDSVKDVLDNISATMPPIKGCIQSAMALRSKVFENMTYADWVNTLNCKVPGTWNLHQLLPNGMDFFIMYSSVSGGIGGTASVNYSSACAYQDALAHYRNAIGEKATTFNLGVMIDDGVLRDNEAVRTALLGTGYLFGITQKEMVALLEHHCNPSLEIPTTPLKSQVLVGIYAPSDIVSRGAEIPVIMTRPLFRGTWNIQNSNFNAKEDAVMDVVKELVGIQSKDEAAAVIATCLIHRLSKALAVPLENLDSSNAIHAYGVDSLVAVELRNWFKWKLDADVAVFEILGNATFEEIGELVAGKSKVVATMLSDRTA